METIGVLGGLFFAAISLRSETKTRKIANLLAITANHREIWKIFLTDKTMARVFDRAPDTVKQPVTETERTFVTLVINHISSVYYAMDHQLVVNLNGLRRDVAQFLSFPIPREVWEQFKTVQNDDFVVFVESCRNGK